MSTVLLDTHILVWLTTDPGRVSDPASTAISEADELAVAAITWVELAWLVREHRLAGNVPGRTWLERLGTQVRTMPITPGTADTAASLPRSFPKDPADRLIYATAIEHGLQLVTKDERLRQYPHTRPLTIW